MSPFYKFILSISVLIFWGCTNQTSRQDHWNLLGGSYWKHGEMLAYNGYWVEAYKDTLNNSFLLLLVDKNKKKEISDSLRLGILPDSVSFDYGTVELNEQQDRSLIAMYKPDDSLYHYVIIKAWRANVQTGKFEPFPITGIRVVANN